MHVLCINNVSFQYPHSKTKALDNVSFEIEKGSYTVIIGHNGSGKSTLSRIIAGLETPSSGTVKILPGLKIGLVFQNPKNQIISGIIHRDTAIGPQNENLSKAETELRVIESLNTVELLDKANSSTLELSLGQTQKVALAGIIALRPEILILDEAMAMLDPENRKDIYTFLDYWHKSGNTVIHITHDKDAIEKAQNVIHMEQGRLTYYGKRERFTFPDFPSLSINKLNPKEIQNLETILSFKNISFDYENQNVLKNLSFNLPKGKLTALTGPSGTGKSTVLELAAGLLKPEEGKIYSSGKIALCQQNAQGALFETFAADDVAFGARNMGIKGKKLIQTVKDSMNKAALPFEEFSERRSFELSGGEQRKLAIAGILALNTDILLFDEPTAGLDEPSRLEVLNMMKDLCSQGKTVLFTTHRTDEALFADCEISLKDYLQKENTTDADFFYKENTLSEIQVNESYKTLKSLRTVTNALSQKNAATSFLSKLKPVLRLIIF
ncbi:MAG: ATP-binding cassette domain-containing protein, partial [Treponema sp.]|nr:ATP-binding cassette domain-containing protein [Treponema sp.]